MKKTLLILFSFVYIITNAQTADEVIGQYSAAMGGLDGFQKVQTVKITGTVTTQGMDLPFTTQMINGRAFRTEAEVMGQFVINCYKDGKGWKLNPFAGAETATDVEGAELLDLKAQASIVSVLMDYKSRGHQVELAGQEDVEGIKTNKIKLTAKEDGRVTNYYISASDNMLIKTTASREFQGQTIEVETIYSDMKEFAGLKFAMQRVQKMSGQVFQTIVYSNVELNVPVEEKIFEK